MMDVNLKTLFLLLHAINPGLKFCLPVHHLPLPLASDHVQEGLSEVVSDAAVANHLIPKDDETQVVDVLYVVLLHINPVLWDKHNKRDNHYLTNIFSLIVSSSFFIWLGLCQHNNSDFIDYRCVILLSLMKNTFSKLCNASCSSKQYTASWYSTLQLVA